ncbi:rod shape-determining protein MreD [Nocardioides yefusunii]|uniref:Rod shape-determining protein MreD n=1 Tax=Nocardioides yefusunii TaxID=2500546 RepID=A0ABW1QVH1_9ACTN|nr:rod shape-determining protein MreD [Nocardioides yefusunii]
MTLARGAFAVAAVVVALALQISLLPHLAWEGVVPNLVLLVVVAAALTRSPRFAMALGFVGGLLMDLVPPADHTAGRWALSLVLVAWFASSARRGTRPTWLQSVLTAAAASFIGSSVFALTGMLLSDPETSTGEMLAVIGAGVGFDVVCATFVLPVTMLALRRLGAAGERERP